LLYVRFTINGREGYSLADGPEVDYYQATIQPGVYHYVLQGESRPKTPHSLSMLESFLLDPDLMVLSDASDVSGSGGDFAQSVAARDGTCVMIGTSLPGTRWKGKNINLTIITLTAMNRNAIFAVITWEPI